MLGTGVHVGFRPTPQSKKQGEFSGILENIYFEQPTVDLMF